MLEAGGLMESSIVSSAIIIIIYLTPLTSLSLTVRQRGLIENAHTKSHCLKSTLLAPAWRLLSRECLMFVPCMAGPTPGQWQCFFSVRSRWRNCSDISALLLCATCWSSTSLTANSIWKTKRKKHHSWTKRHIAACLLKQRLQKRILYRTTQA